MDSIMERIAYVPCNPRNHGGSRVKDAIKYLVYHYTGNDGDHDTANAAFYRDNVVQASAHYFVDDDSVTQSVGDLTVAWAVGGKKWSDCPQTGGGKLYGIVTNSNSLSIEMCDTERNGVYNLSEQTRENALALGKVLMQRYNIPIERVVRHFDVTGKHCPAYFMDEAKWAAFKARLAEKEDDMPRFNAIAEMPDWAQNTIRKMVDKKYLTGGGGAKDADGRPADLDLSLDMLRVFVINDRAGVYGK